jgi:peptide deformylase
MSTSFPSEPPTPPYSIKIYGSPILRKATVPLSKDEIEDIKEVLPDILKVMYEKKGVGLAGPQIGISAKFFVIDISETHNSPQVFINPEITYQSDTLIEDQEGCLSFPGLHILVKRPDTVSIKAINENGEEVVIDKATGLLARVIQHEYEHLEGLFFIEKLPSWDYLLLKDKLKKAYKKYKKE